MHGNIRNARRRIYVRAYALFSRYNLKTNQYYSCDPQFSQAFVAAACSVGLCSKGVQSEKVNLVRKYSLVKAGVKSLAKQLQNWAFSKSFRLEDLTAWLRVKQPSWMSTVTSPADLKNSTVQREITKIMFIA